MDKRTEKAIDKLDTISALALRQEMLWCIAQALIDTHPDPAVLRAAFDRTWARTQTTASFLAAPEDARTLMRDLVDNLFRKHQ